ncbi:P-loop containing nucleoside triphosphate hydrolase protein [Cadophora sp. MPI-SDFR-AT-0126]|nr:P-loop containing nucleoside triphosphate hydrolase protein [Leotiomycetes sp. MPI-SDFR-AT-0126]
MQMLGDSVRYLRQFPAENDATRAWKSLETSISDSLSDMERVIRHLNDIINYSKVNMDRQVHNLALRHAPVILPEETCTFPVKMTPRERNSEFYGRKEELDRINQYLDHKGNNALRTYTIYGRRGVGKTDIALEYAHTNPAQFEAIFWVQCETSASLRSSFTDIAVALQLPGADRNGHHEENQLGVQKWLKTTKRQWLLIFDNAERDTILKGYWPVGASGAILITSRKYYNFTNDAQRQGDTVKPFNDTQSWDLLMKLLGPHWQDMDRNGKIKVSEDMAARKFLKSLGGLALAIQQAAQLIKNEQIGGPTIASTFEYFKENLESLPKRQALERSELIHALDSLWNMTFNHLSRNAKDLLKVLSLLSPDGILIDLFLPKNQRALDGKLAFCKQHANLIDPDSQFALSSVITAPTPLRDAIRELIDFKLIKQEGRELWAHRVVQEAMNYQNSQDLQDYFDSASALVYEAFPKQVHGDYLSSQWGTCETYISHGIHLSLQFANLQKSEEGVPLKGSPRLIDLLSNCAWYLYEVSDYDVCLRIVETGRLACGDDTESLRYATLCNVAGAAYYELNKLVDCRTNFEIFHSIQAKLLPENDLQRSSSIHNMGLLESTSDNLSKAKEYFNQAIAIRFACGDSASSLLANSYLCMSRVHFLEKEYDQAFNMLAQSEALYVRTSGANAHFMSHVHYAYGNIEYAQKRWVNAKRSYDTCLKISLASSPIHPITAAAYYSLGCVENELDHRDNAKAYLDKALAIAQLRSPSRDDGTMARIMWKKSVVLENDTFGQYIDEAKELRLRAELALRKLSDNGEGFAVITLDDEGNEDQLDTEDAYDALVPGYFR